MPFPDHVLVVRASVEPGREAAFNRWYDTEHIPDVYDRLQGVFDAARYEVGLGDGSHQFIAMYAFESAAALQAAMEGPGLRQLIQRFDEAVGSFSTRSRTTYTKIFQLTKPV